ncbi:hypothetical protein ACIGZJ_19560 [Kitasatospora sp. NPDC052868]|uniref:hypothetical protein n=1 Tax=Kitasatospora sp. NPDC052868 TaxID=3364060 RepID=UPI0037C53AD3
MSFETRLGELLNEDDREPAGLDPGRIIARSRRRRSRRVVGAGAAGLAVALVCGAAAVTVQHTGGGGGAAAAPALPGTAAAPAAAPTPSAVPTPGTAALPLSPVRQVAAGEKLEFADGARIWVTATEKCDEYRDRNGVWGSGSGCRDSTSDNLDHDRPSIYAQGSFGTDRVVLASLYLGPAPARIVAFQNGTSTVATLVTTAGMQGWTAYYVVLPGEPTAAQGRFATPAVAAYDAEGKLLAELPGRGADGAVRNAPAHL